MFVLYFSSKCIGLGVTNKCGFCFCSVRNSSQFCDCPFLISVYSDLSPASLDMHLKHLPLHQMYRRICLDILKETKTRLLWLSSSKALPWYTQDIEEYVFLTA